MQKLILLLALPLATSLKANGQLKKTGNFDPKQGQKNSFNIFAPGSKNQKGNNFYKGEKRVTISMTNATFSQIWDTFFRQTHLSNSIATDVRSLSLRTSIFLENAPVSEFLELLEKKFPVSCTTRNDIIIITLELSRKRGLSGTVTDTLSTPLAGASISVKGKRNGVISDERGRYTINNIHDSTILIISYAGKEPVELMAGGNQTLDVQLKDKGPLPAVVRDGHQTFSKINATGAYYLPLMEQARKTPKFNIVDGMNGINFHSTTKRNFLLGTLPIPLRGISTLSGTQHTPMIIGLFPLNESTDHINGFDVLSQTQIVEGESGALHGTYAANGVIHAELQHWANNGKPQVEFNMNTGIVLKPDLDYQRGLTTDAFLDFDSTAYLKGLVHNTGPTEKPFRNLFWMLQQGLVSRGHVDSMIRVFSARDLRDEVSQLLYRIGFSQQYHLAFRYGNEKFGLYSSIGQDENKSPQIGNDVTRTTSFTNIGFNDKGFDVSISYLFSTINNRFNFYPVPMAIPIGTLRDKNGKPNALAQQYSDEFLNAIPWNVLNWKYDPLEELALADHRINRSLHQITAKLGYQFLQHFNLSVAYQYGLMLYENRNHYAEGSFYMRDLYNRFTNPTTMPIPRGSILDTDEIKSKTNNARVQFKYTQQIKKFNVSALGGLETHQQDINIDTRRIYGYDIGYNQAMIKYTEDFQVATGGHEKIPHIDKQTDSSDRFFSYIFSARVKYNEKFIVSITGRKDESNRFSLPLNKKGFPLWAVGGAWLINNDFKARVSIGTSGNVNYSLSPSRTIQLVNPNSSDQLYVTGNAFFEKLAWEKITMLNTGIDFNFFNGQLSGTVDFYIKKAKDLVQPVRNNPTSGSSVVYDNSGAIRGHGINMMLQAKHVPLTHELHFASNLFINYTKNKITSSSSLIYTAEQFTNALNNLGKAGDPPGAIYAYAYDGVNEHGDPLGLLNGQPSTDYAKLFTDSSLTSIICVGPTTPNLFGSLALSLTWRSFFFTTVFNTKLGHYARKRALNYNDLANHLSDGTEEYYSRWQKSGDETKIPAFRVTDDSNRDQFFANSTYNVVSADHVRWQSIQLGYNFTHLLKENKLVKNIEVFFTLQNAGILWRKNKFGVDPDVEIGAYPEPKTFTFSINAKF